MNRVLRWIVDYWWIPALVLVGVLVSFFGRRLAQSVFGSDFQDRLDLELDVIRAKREVREVRAKSDRDAASRFVRKKYAARFAELDAYERARAMSLENDPEELAKLMVRLGKKRTR
jgi:hypothetical protein